MGHMEITYRHGGLVRAVLGSMLAAGIATVLLDGGRETQAGPRPYVGIWSTSDGQLRQELRTDGRYAESRGVRVKAQTGRYEVSGDHIVYVDASGARAYGIFRDGVLHRDGLVLYRQR